MDEWKCGKSNRKDKTFYVYGQFNSSVALREFIVSLRSDIIWPNSVLQGSAKSI